MSDSIEQVISASIADLPGNDGSEVEVNGEAAESEEEVETVEETTVTENEPAPAVSAIEAEPEDELAKELGLKPGAKDNRIPYSRVQKIIEKAKQTHAAELAQRETRLAALAQYEAPEFRQQFDIQSQALQMIQEQPELFLQRLAEADPRYAQLLQPAAPQQSAEGAIEPDVLLGDGTLGYSPQAMQRMIDQRTAIAEQRIQQQFEKQYGPMAQDWKSAQMMRGAQDKAQNQLAAAHQWVGFQEHQQAILEALQSDRSLSLEQAYIKIVSPKLSGNRDEMRKQLLAELSQKPRGAQGIVKPSGTAPVAAAGPRDIEDVIRESIAGLDK